MKIKIKKKKELEFQQTMMNIGKGLGAIACDIEHLKHVIKDGHENLLQNVLDDRLDIMRSIEHLTALLFEKGETR